MTVFDLLAVYWKDQNEVSIYVLDSFPIVVCDNCQIPRQTAIEDLAVSELALRRMDHPMLPSLSRSLQKVLIKRQTA